MNGTVNQSPINCKMHTVLGGAMAIGGLKTGRKLNTEKKLKTGNNYFFTGCQNAL